MDLFGKKKQYDDFDEAENAALQRNRDAGDAYDQWKQANGIGGPKSHDDIVMERTEYFRNKDNDLLERIGSAVGGGIKDGFEALVWGIEDIVSKVLNNEGVQDPDDSVRQSLEKDIADLRRKVVGEE